jgi:serine/threonine protein kinase
MSESCKILTSTVLFSHECDLWKIADFGITSEGATFPKPTDFARGTTCYRTPELLSEKPSYTNKVDIWALGYILYELASGKRAFNSDVACNEHAVRRPIPPLTISTPFPSLQQSQLGDYVNRLMQVDWTRRPMSPEVHSDCVRFLNLADPTIATRNET